MTLNGLSGQTGLGAVKALLVSPGGARSLVFLSGAAFSANQPSANITFSDSAPTQVVQNGALITGSYRATSYDNPAIPSPAGPAPQVPALISTAGPGAGVNSRTLTTAFNGAAATGDWALFFYDNGGTASNAAVSGGWCLNLTPAAGTLMHNGVRANFAFNARYRNKGADGSFLYTKHLATGDMKVQGTGLQTISIVGNTAIFLIQATVNGTAGYTAQVTVTDNGDPGSSDTFGLQLTDSSNATVADLSFTPLTIETGNIQVRSN